MGNTASYYFGSGSQSASSESPEPNGRGISPRGAEKSEQDKAVHARYSELFGGKPKSTAKKSAARKKKKLRSNNNVSGCGKKEANGAERGFDSGNAADEEGGDSAPVSPFRGKAAWVQAGAVTEETEGTKQQQQQKMLKMRQLKQQQQKMLVKAVAAKIALLEKEKTQEGVLLEGAGVVAPNQSAPDSQSQQQALVPSGGASEAARTRAAVTNALYSGADPASTSGKELLMSAGGGGVLDGAPGGGLGGATAGAPAKHINPRPLPQRNFKLKV